ncbi:MAG: PEP-CTERM sorting domain-containing protein [Exilibacterium sp.]
MIKLLLIATFIVAAAYAQADAEKAVISVPEPSSIALLFIGLVGLLIARRK